MNFAKEENIGLTRSLGIVRFNKLSVTLTFEKETLREVNKFEEREEETGSERDYVICTQIVHIVQIVCK